MKRLSILKTQDAVITERIAALKKQLAEVRDCGARQGRGPSLLTCDNHPTLDYHLHRFSCVKEFLEPVAIGKKMMVARDVYKCTDCGTERVWG